MYFSSATFSWLLWRTKCSNSSQRHFMNVQGSWESLFDEKVDIPVISFSSISSVIHLISLYI